MATLPPKCPTCSTFVQETRNVYEFIIDNNDIDQYFVVADENWTVGALRNGIHDTVGLVDATRHYRLAYGDTIPPAQIKLNSIDPTVKLLYIGDKIRRVLRRHQKVSPGDICTKI